MSIRTFKAANLQAALADIREQMGPDASVLHTRQVRDGWFGWLGRTQVEVVAGLRKPGDQPKLAIDLRDDQPHDIRSLSNNGPQTAGSTRANGTASMMETMGGGRRIEPMGSNVIHGYASSNPSLINPSPDPLEVNPLAGPLRKAGVSEEVMRRWLASASSFAANLNDYDPESIDAAQQLEHLQRAVARELNLAGPIRTQPGERHVVALVGPTGVGKTTTVAKLAAGFRIEARRRVGLLTIDTYRIAAVQQLKAYAEIMDLPMEVVEKPTEMQAALESLGDVDLVLIDTAGRSPRSDARIDQLSEFLRAARPDETHLVLSATSSCDNIRTTIKGFQPVGATSVILTKLDETPHTAGALAALTASDRHLATPLSYVTHGQQVPDDISVADAPHLVGSLLPIMLGNLETSSQYREAA